MEINTTRELYIQGNPFDFYITGDHVVEVDWFHGRKQYFDQIENIEIFWDTDEGRFPIDDKVYEYLFKNYPLSDMLLDDNR